MKKVMKRIAGMMATALACINLFACQKTDVEVKFVEFQDKSIYLLYGEKYTIENFVYDENGNRYALNAMVTNANGENISTTDEIIVQGNYQILYSVEVESEERQKTVNIIACNVPQIITGDVVRECIVNMPITLPMPSDNELVGEQTVNYNREIFYIGQDCIEKVADYDGISELYTPKKLGKYCYKITATNEKGIVNYVKSYFNVNTLESWDVLPCLEEIGRITTSRKEVSCSFVANKDLPNNDNYKGNAFKYEGVISNAFLWVKMPYTAMDILALKDDYQIQFTYYIESDNISISNRDASKDEAHYNAFSAANYLGNNKEFKLNKWTTHTVDIEDFAKTLGRNNKGEYTSTFLFALMEQNKTVNVYLGEITLQPISK